MKAFNVKKVLLIMLAILMIITMVQGSQIGMIASLTEGCVFDSVKDLSIEFNLMEDVNVHFEYSQDDFEMDYILLAGGTDTTTPEPSPTNEEGSNWTFNIQMILSDHWAHS